jgi:hypothetical protein
MKTNVVVILIISAMTSATGLVLFRYHRHGDVEIAQFFDIWAILGCASYLMGPLSLVTCRQAG